MENVEAELPELIEENWNALSTAMNQIGAPVVQIPLQQQRSKAAEVVYQRNRDEEEYLHLLKVS